MLIRACLDSYPQLFFATVEQRGTRYQVLYCIFLYCNTYVGTVDDGRHHKKASSQAGNLVVGTQALLNLELTLEFLLGITS